MQYPTERRTPYIVAIGLIWGFGTAMLAICIPLVSITQSGVILPLSVIVGTCVGTVIVWRSPSLPPSPTLSQHVSDLQQQIASLEAKADQDGLLADQLLLQSSDKG
jgi:hypothetical protein